MATYGIGMYRYSLLGLFDSTERLKDAVYFRNGVLDLYPDSCVILESDNKAIQIEVDETGGRVLSILKNREVVPAGFLRSLSPDDLKVYRALAFLAHFILCNVFGLLEQKQVRMCVGARDKAAALEGTELILPAAFEEPRTSIDFGVRANDYESHQLVNLVRKLESFCENITPKTSS
jgi:hypothetical protein